MDDAKKPGEKQPGEKKPGKFHYNPVGMSGKEAVLQENDEIQENDEDGAENKAENKAEHSDAAAGRKKKPADSGTKD
jgi:hypothetical protein